MMAEQQAEAGLKEDAEPKEKGDHMPSRATKTRTVLTGGEEVGAHLLSVDFRRQLPPVSSIRMRASSQATDYEIPRSNSDVAVDTSRWAAAVIDVVPVMIWTAGVDRLCYYFNRPWLTYRGRRIEDELGTGWLSGLHADDRERRQAIYEESSAEPRSFHVDYRLERYDGAYRWIMETGAPRFSSSGTFLGYAGSCVDIHERKLAEQSVHEVEDALRREIRELQEVAYATTHDLQEPLRTISNYTQLIARREATSFCDASSDECLRFVLTAAERMHTLIGDLLRYTSLTHSLEPSPELTDGNSAFQDAVSACQAAVAESSALVTRDDLPQLPVDQKHLIALFQNLLSNAMKYRRSEVTPRIHVSVTAERDEWLFQVSDNGIGFEPRHADRIFQMFHRLHSRTEYTGSGLGLAICKKIVERYGGRIWATSQPGHGSQFFFAIPK